jgi:hypothetical protein
LLHFDSTVQRCNIANFLKHAHCVQELAGTAGASSNPAAADPHEIQDEIQAPNPAPAAAPAPENMSLRPSSSDDDSSPAEASGSDYGRGETVAMIVGVTAAMLVALIAALVCLLLCMRRKSRSGGIKRSPGIKRSLHIDLSAGRKRRSGGKECSAGIERSADIEPLPGKDVVRLLRYSVVHSASITHSWLLLCCLQQVCHMLAVSLLFSCPRALIRSTTSSCSQAVGTLAYAPCQTGLTA